MPSETSAVGPLVVPVAATPVGTNFADPFVDTLLDFSAFYLKNALDTRLASIRPPGTVSDAVPVTNRFTFDPLEPRGINKHMPLPALFVFWTGESRRVEFTQLYTYRVRDIDLLYVYEELPSLSSLEERRGWSNAVDAALHKMGERQRHDVYSPPDGSPGMTLYQALAPLGVVKWEYMGGKPGRFGIDEGPLAERRAARTSGRDWPAVKGRFEVWERVQQRTLDDPLDVMTDMQLTINGGSESDQTVLVMERIMPAPDGTEEL